MQTIRDDADTFYVLDFDRTLADTDKLHTFFEGIIEEETPISSDVFRQARSNSERSGGSFDSIDYLRRLLKDMTHSQKTWLQVQESFIVRAQKEEFLEPGAKELLKSLEERGIPYGIITYGGEAWQLAKLEAARLIYIPHIVTHIQDKGRILTGWRREDGKGFIIPPALTKGFQPLHVSSIVFLDDKAVSFKGIPEGVTGIHVLPIKGHQLASQQGELPAGVVSVIGMREAVRILF